MSKCPQCPHRDAVADLEKRLPIFTGTRSWKQDPALIREFQRAWNKREIETRKRAAQ